MASTIISILLLIVAAVIGIGVAFFLVPTLIDLDEQTQIIIAAVLTLFSFISLYFMAKGHGGG